MSNLRALKYSIFGFKILVFSTFLSGCSDVRDLEFYKGEYLRNKNHYIEEFKKFNNKENDLRIAYVYQSDHFLSSGRFVILVFDPSNGVKDLISDKFILQGKKYGFFDTIVKYKIFSIDCKYDGFEIESRIFLINVSC